MHFGTWLSDVRAQAKANGVDFRELACHAHKLTPYVQDRMARALQNAEEVYAQLPSVTYDDEKQRYIWEELREPYIARMGEVLALLGACLTAIGCTEEELSRSYLVAEGNTSAEGQGEEK